MPVPLLATRNGEAFILGKPVQRGGMEVTLLAIKGLVKTGGAHLVVTANVDHLIDLNDQTPLTAAYDQASMRTVDGAPVLLTFRALGAKGLHRVTGADLIEAVVKASAKMGWRVAITGGASETLRTAVIKLRQRFPDATIEAIPMPYLQSSGDPRSLETVSDLNSYQPNVTFICLGAPKQESWFLEWQEELPAGVYIGAGAAVDFAAGTKKRAPKLVQQVGFEWGWRLMQEFRRLAPRYLLKGPRFLSVVIQSVKNRGNLSRNVGPTR